MKGEPCPPACTEICYRNTSCKEQKAGKLKEGTTDGRIKKIVQNKRKSSTVICRVVKYLYVFFVSSALNLSSAYFFKHLHILLGGFTMFCRGQGNNSGY